MRLALFFFMVIFLSFNLLRAQNDEAPAASENEVELRTFDQEKWEALTKDVQFEKPEKKELQESENNGNWSLGSWNLGAAKNIFFVLAISILLFFIIRLLNNQFIRKDKKIKAEVSAIDFEDDLENQDLQAFLNKALNTKDYKQAIRLYYLIIIQDLAHKGWIKWEKDKTNSQYVYEMSGKHSASQFREITGQFNFIWYGDQIVDETLFLKESPKFQKFIDLIGSAV